MELISFIYDLNKVYTTYRRQWEELQSSAERNSSEIEKVRRRRVIAESEKALLYPNGKIPDNVITETQYKARLESLQDNAADIREQLDNLQNEAISNFQNMKSDFSVKMADELTANPETLDMAGAVLIQSGALTDEDIVTFARRYNENPSMLRMIQLEADKRNLVPLSVSIKKFFDADSRLNDFDIAIRDVTTGLSPNRSMGDIGHSYWMEKGFQTAKANIGNADALAV